MANYAYMGKGIITLQEEGVANAPAFDVGNASALSFNVNENIIRLPNYRTAGGGTYAQVNRIENVEISMTLHDLSPENLAMVLFGSVTEADNRATIQALTTGAKTFKMIFTGLNEANTGKQVIVTAHRVKIGAAQGLGLIGDEFAALEVTGEVLIDTSVTGDGLSQFFMVEMDRVE
ncbi:hypothetical protein DN824_20510 [Stutzerimonas nosocomialis]|uniref:hypothetical protein n=1 Tax=Stutzerimonas nosocomialis TaxID=1056496 RepID=UPI0011084D2D|nr:hypothetical protein [Stutzerimonas nosocomialis]TLX54867.1 hypothetical protein DN824_20510 [Stutzerimonas nosocomialis]